AAGGGPGRSARGGSPRLLRGRPGGADRRRPAAPGLGRTSVAQPADGRDRQPGPAADGERGLPPELTRLHRLVSPGRDQTAGLFAPVRELFGWVYRVAHELSNLGELTAAQVHNRWGGLIRGMGRLAGRRADLAGSLQHFVKVSRSYEPWLFHCYDVPDL